MRRLLALIAALALVGALAGSSLAASGSPKSSFVGDFDLIDGGTGQVIGHATASLNVPTAQQLVAGTFDFKGADGNTILASHGQMGWAGFWYDPDFPEPGGLGVNVAQGDGVECVYYGPNNSVCHEWIVQFIDYLDPAKGEQVDFAWREPGNADWIWGYSAKVGKGEFKLKLNN